MSLLPPEIVETFHDSFDRCRADPKFFDTFYDRLLTVSGDMQDKFKQAELDRLKVMARDAIFLIMMASSGQKHSIEKVNQLGRYHQELNVTPELYDVWLDVLMSVVEETDNRYDAEVDEAWRELMGIGISLMK